MGVAANPLSVSHDMGPNVDAMDCHHEIRELALGLLDAVGPPIAVVAVVDIGGDEILG